jgi:tyrosinase
VPTGEPATKDEPVPGAPAAKDEHAAAPASEGPAPRDEPKGTTAANAEATPTRETTAATGVAVAPAAAAPSGKSPSTEWITNVRVKKHTLDQTFRVLVFLGEPAAGTSGPNLVFAPELVGRVTVLGRGHTNATCARCNVRRDIVVSGTVPLTEDLRAAVAAGGLASLGAADVLPYLREKLCWRVTLFDGSETPAGTVDGLVVSVVSTAVEEVEGELPVYSGVYETHPEATAGKPAGHTAEVAPA